MNTFQKKSIYQLEKQLLGETLEGREGFVLAKAYNSTLVDDTGREYIDFTSGWNVANIGWSRPEIVQVITEQLQKFPYAPMWCSTEQTVNLAQKLQTLFPKNLNTFFKTTGGTEANEVALKIARAYTGKKKIFSFYGEYHGQTYGSISLGNAAKSTNPFEPLVPGFIRIQPPYCYKCPFGDGLSEQDCVEKSLEAIRQTIQLEGNPAAFLCETVLTCPGVIVPPMNFFKGLRKICDEYEMLLIIDEVGTGFGRTGKMFGFEHYGFIPDIVTFAKALSGGYGPIGGVATDRKIADVMLGKGGTSTYGWHTLSAVASLKNLEILEKENLIKQAAEKGKYILEKLKKELKNVEIAGDIRGLGLEIGIELVRDKKSKAPNKEAALKVVSACLENGLHIVWAGRTTTIMIMPPLIITKEEIDKGIEILTKSIKESQNNIL